MIEKYLQKRGDLTVVIGNDITNQNIRPISIYAYYQYLHQSNSNTCHPATTTATDVRENVQKHTNHPKLGCKLFGISMVCAHNNAANSSPLLRRHAAMWSCLSAIFSLAGSFRVGKHQSVQSDFNERVVPHSYVLLGTGRRSQTNQEENRKMF